jgi:hypothetical protein
LQGDNKQWQSENKSLYKLLWQNKRKLRRWKGCCSFLGRLGRRYAINRNNLFKSVCNFGNDISTFPDFPAEIRAPQGTLSGVSGFQVHLGSRKIYTPGDKADVLVAMNPAALKVNVKHIKPNAIVIIDTDSFLKNDLTKAQFVTEDPFAELGLNSVQVVAVPISSMVKDGLAEFELDNNRHYAAKICLLLIGLLAV